MLFVPTILATAQVWLTATPTFATWAHSGLIPINGAFALTVLYNIYYLALHKQIGLLITPYLWGLLYAANRFADYFGPNAMLYATALHFVGWAVQIAGHEIFEKRSAAILKDPVQPLVLAPFFVFCEMLFDLGFFPQTKKDLTNKIGVKVAEYRKSHPKNKNQRIHMIFVPTILATAQVWLSATPTVATWALSKQLPINSAFILTAIYNLYYLSLHKQIGALMTPILWGMLFGANKFLSHFGTQKAMVIATAVHFTSWAFQIYGHQVYEKRAPAFIKDPIQALVLAPLFVFCEFLFELGFYPKTKKELTDKIGVKVAEFRKLNPKTK